MACVGHLFSKFCENRFSGFCLSLLSDKQINADENVTSLSDVKITHVDSEQCA